MTSEVCVMNKLAVVLAADSATTVSYFGENGPEQRYFKGANKIFQLSDHHPVGMMIFDSADILKVPWEIVIKSFRNDLGAKSFNSVDQYASEFFSYLKDNVRLFPESVQHNNFMTAARFAVGRLVFGACEGIEDDGERKTAITTAIVQRRAEVEPLPSAPCIPADWPGAISGEWIPKISAEALEWFKIWELPNPDDMEALSELAIWEIIKSPHNFMSTAGLVFAGYGDHDIFPAMYEYKSCGIILGNHVHEETSSAVIDHELPAWMSAFAQTTMSDTFTLGLSQDAYASVLQELHACLPDFANELAALAGVDINGVVGVDELIAKARKTFADSILERAWKDHTIPLRRVLGALPVDEMAELAETLINLQSLKEKVTKPSETVGGPVDVAVITRNEGLVWIRRKHYFDLSLNSRYVQRQALK